VLWVINSNAILAITEANCRMRTFQCTALLLLTGFTLGHAHQSGNNNAMSPVTRVVEMLQGLAKQTEADGKKEEDLYETFVCWAKTIIDSKTASNAAAEARIQELQTYIADLDAGRIELTTERVDLEKELEEVLGDIETATEIREKEKADYASAKLEMTQAIDALEDAIKVLKEATTEEKKDSSFLRVRSEVSSSSRTAAQEAASLRAAADLGEKFLTKGDSLFLRRLLTGDVPRASWKKLNRKATFKMSYKARSGKIQEVLAKLLDTFDSNLKEATEKEVEAMKSYQELMKAKTAQKDAAQEALIKMEKENGARGLSKADATTEMEALQQQVKDDKMYIEQVTKTLEEKKTEWKVRMALRTAELGAISKAIAILHSDDARDLFKKSFKSQGYSFLQTTSRQRRGIAVSTLTQAAKDSKDDRLVLLASSLASKGHFDEVIKAIDTMVSTLKAEETTDLKVKEDCETTRADDTRTASLTSRAIDELTDAITQLETEIKELEAQIEDAQKKIEAIDAELAKTKKIREEEAVEYAANKKDDQEAVSLVTQAKDVLADFYKSNNLMLVQKKQPAVAAGKAPPPPPTTWEAPYGGQTEESTGIVAILEMIVEDIQKDIADADKEEAEAIALYDKTVKALTTEKQGLQKQISEWEGIKADKAESVITKGKEKSTKKKQLGAVMKKMADAEPGCDFALINYAERAKNRQTEIDGLLKAKAILSGGKFDGLPDPNREIKPGDAFLQSSPRLRGA